MIRTNLGMTQEEFGKRLGIKRNTVATYESDSSDKIPSNQVIVAICREYNVNEHWLRTGEGEPTNQLSHDEELAKIVNSILSGDDEFTKSVYMHLGKAPQEVWDYLKEFVENVYDDLHKSEQSIFDETPEETEEELIAKYSAENEKGEVG